jgi:hypothetical protein
MVIATLVLTIGLIGLAQLFIVASYNNSYAVATSAGVNDAQRLIEHWKAVAVINGAGASQITSSTWNSSTNSCAAFTQLVDENGDSYDFEASAFHPSVWVFDDTGALVGSASPAKPVGYEGITLVAPAKNSRYVIIQMNPKSNDPRYGQQVTLSAIVSSVNINN